MTTVKTLEQIEKEYNVRKGKLPFLIDEIRFSLKQELDRKAIKIHQIEHRIKEFDSFVDKIRRKDIKDDPFSEIHDLVGLRVICLFLQDLQLIGDIIQNNFEVFEVDDKVAGPYAEIFGYMDVQYKAKLKKAVTVSGYEEINNYPFEIQVRTIAQDAWANISHYLDYKQKSAFSPSLKRDFYALSGLFYVADTHFTILRSEQLKFLTEGSPSKNDIS